MNFADLFKSNTPTRQLLLVVGICAVVGALLLAGYLSFFQTRYDVLFSNLRDADAATIVAELDKQKVPYKLSDGGATILAPSELVAKTRLQLMSTTIPLKGTVGFELFNKSDMGLTEFAQAINYQRALQGELARTIMAMDAVDEARIHLALPEHAIFRDETKQPKASVTVLTRPGRQLSADTIRGIQRLVAAAVPDLDIGNVVVLDGHGAVVSDSASLSPQASPIERKRAIEAAFETNVRNALRESFPTRPIDVAVWAGLDEATMATVSDPQAQVSLAPLDRGFPLRVSITVSPPSTPAEESAVRTVVIAAIHADPNRDVITYAVSAPPVAPPPAPERRAAPRTAVATFPLPVLTGGPIDGRVLIWGGAALVLVAAAAVLLGQRPGRRRLSARQRGDYARRLKAVLEGGPADGAP